MPWEILWHCFLHAASRSIMSPALLPMICMSLTCLSCAHIFKILFCHQHGRVEASGAQVSQTQCSLSVQSDALDVNDNICLKVDSLSPQVGRHIWMCMVGALGINMRAIIDNLSSSRNLLMMNPGGLHWKLKSNKSRLAIITGEWNLISLHIAAWPCFLESSCCLVPGCTCCTFNWLCNATYNFILNLGKQNFNVSVSQLRSGHEVYRCAELKVESNIMWPDCPSYVFLDLRKKWWSRSP